MSNPEQISNLKTINEELRARAPNERAEYFESLSKTDRQQFRDQHSVSRVETSIKSTSLVLGEATREVTVSAHSTLGVHLWDWVLEASWEYDGDTVTAVNVNDYANVYDWCWSYEGTTSQMTDVSQSQFEARRQASLSCQAAWGVLVFNANPHARVKGFSDGDFDVLEKSDSPSLL